MLETKAAFELFCGYQLRWLQDKAKVKGGRKSRRVGWTWMEAFDAVTGRVSGDSDYWISSVDATATAEFIGYCEDWARMFNAVAKITDEKVVIEDNEIHQKVMTFANGRRITAGSSNPNFFRSKEGDAAWDEAAFHDNGEQMAKAMHATSQFWGYSQRVWSSHNGSTSYFARMMEDILAGRLKGTVHTVTILDAVADGIVERIQMRKKKLSYVPKPDAKARQEWLDDMRATCPSQEIWDEEYMCIPSDSGRQFLTADLIRSCEEPNLKVLDALDDAFDQLEGPIYGGYDVGRSHDLSVLDAGQRVGDVLWERALLELKNMSFGAQKAILRRFMRHSKVVRLCIDKGLIGLQLYEELAEEFGKYRVEGMQLTDAVQSQLALPLRAAFEDRTIRIAALDKRREALRKPKKIIVGGNVRFQTPRDKDGHCDQFVALYLMYAAADMRKQPLMVGLDKKPIGW